MCHLKLFASVFFAWKWYSTLRHALWFFQKFHGKTLKKRGDDVKLMSNNEMSPQMWAFVQYLGDGPMIMEKVVHIPKYVKPWYIYQLILSQLSWNEHSSGSDKIIWYMYQDFTYFGMYHFPQSFWQKTIFYLHINLEYVTTEGFSLQLERLARFPMGTIWNLNISRHQ